MNSDVAAELEQQIVRTEVHKCDASRDWRWVPVYNTWAVGPVGKVLGAAVHPLPTAVVAVVIAARCLRCRWFTVGTYCTIDATRLCATPGPNGRAGGG